MKKRHVLMVIILGMAAGFLPPRVQAYSPHYLPGGKNYLSADNFQYSAGILSTIDPFLVKPYTDYTLTIPRSYSENAEGSDVTLYFYCDDEEMDSVSYDASLGLSTVFGTNFFSVTFQTAADINYLGLSFADGRDPLSPAIITQMQLEEGTVSTATTTVDLYVPGTMTDVNGPYFQGNPVVISDADDPITLLEIQAGLSAYDAVDGNVSADIEIVSDGYTGNGAVLGNYTIVFEVSDTAENVTQFTLTVKVVDINPPVITGPGTVVVPHPLVKTVAELKALLAASDQHDGMVSESLVVISDGYSSLSTTIGVYEIVFEASDGSGNTAQYPLQVSVVDTADPIFSGISEVTIGYDQQLSVAEIKAALGATDGYDGDLTAQIQVVSDGYSTHLHEVGQYLVGFEVTDSSGNSAQKTVCVNVVDVIGPIIYFDTSVIRIYNTTVLSLTDFKALLVQSRELDQHIDYAIDVRFDSYTPNATVPGIYHLTLGIKSPDGTETTKTFQIMVRQKSTGGLDGIPGLPEDPTFFQRNRSWIIGSAMALPILISNVVVFIVKRKPH